MSTRKTPMSRGSAPLRRDPGQAKASVPIPKKPKQRKCENKTCKTPFTRTAAFQTWCSPPCGYEVAKARLAKAETKRQAAERAAYKVKRESQKNRKTLMAEAQKAFNAFIRARDLGAGLTCIDCGQPFEPQRYGGSVDAGHYLSRGSAPHLKFNENNTFAQRKNCNRPGGTTRDAFRAGVLARIGLAALEELESDQSVKKYTADDLRGIRDTYRAKARNLERQA